MSGSKGEYYAAKSDMDEFDTIGDKLAQDLRSSIRTLVSCRNESLVLMTLFLVVAVHS